MNLREHLASHDGVITLEQAAAVGVGRSVVARCVARDEWLRVGRGVYFVADRALSARARMRIACLSVGPRAVLSGTSAAWWHGITERPPRVATVTAPRGRHPSALSNVRVVHRDLQTVDIVNRDDLPVTGIALSVLDAAAVDGIAVIDSALLRGRVSLDQLGAAHARYPGRRGAVRSASMLRASAAGARSEAERILLRLLTQAAIAGWSANHPTCGYIVDLAFPDARIVVEFDGMAFHSDAKSFQDDRTRQNVLITNGWTVLRFTWQDLTERPQQVIAQIRAALKQNR